MSNEDSARKLSEAYSGYLKVNNQKEMNLLDESIEETLTRLEELGSGLKMLQTEREKFEGCDLTEARCGLNALCQRIHKLDEMSKKVLQDVEALEVVVDEAESNLTNTTEGKLRNLLKPLFFMKADVGSSSATPQNQHSTQFVPQSTFKTESFFTNSSDVQGSPSSPAVPSSS